MCKHVFGSAHRQAHVQVIGQRHLLPIGRGQSVDERVGYVVMLRLHRYECWLAATAITILGGIALGYSPRVWYWMVLGYDTGYGTLAQHEVRQWAMAVGYGSGLRQRATAAGTVLGYGSGGRYWGTELGYCRVQHLDAALGYGTG